MKRKATPPCPCPFKIGERIVSVYVVNSLLKNADAFDSKRSARISTVQSITPRGFRISTDRDLHESQRAAQNWTSNPTDVATVEALHRRIDIREQETKATWQAYRQSIESNPKWQYAKRIMDVFGSHDPDSLARSDSYTEEQLRQIAEILSPSSVSSRKYVTKDR